jgi:hypothetical protein
VACCHVSLSNQGVPRVQKTLRNTAHIALIFSDNVRINWNQENQYLWLHTYLRPHSTKHSLSSEISVYTHTQNKGKI